VKLTLEAGESAAFSMLTSSFGRYQVSDSDH
jgi:hypothetical protein